MIRGAARLVAVSLAATLLGVTAAPQALPPSPTPASKLQVGDTVTAFDAEGLDGKTEHVDFPAKGAPTVLFFFLSSCPHCHKMIPEMNRQFDRRPKGLRVLGVMLDQEPPGFFMGMPVSFPVLRGSGRELGKSYKIPRVPMMVRVAPGGKVEDVLEGEQDAMTLGRLFKPV